MFKRIPPLIIVLLCLAAIGFLVQVFTEPLYTLLSIGLIVLIYFMVTNYMKTGRFFKRTHQSNVKKLKQAMNRARPSGKKSDKSARRDHSFRVIEGSKGKQNENPNDTDSNIYH